MATRLARHHAQNSRVGKLQRGLDHCGRCRIPVPHDSDHLRAQLQGSAVAFHWHCFLALMRGGRDTRNQYKEDGLKAVTHPCCATQDPRMRDSSTASDEMPSVREVAR